MKNLLILLIVVSLCSASISCSRVEESVQGNLQTVKLTKPDSIPIEYGSLVSVTANPQFSRWAQLWFVDDDETIRVVTVGYFDKIMQEKVTVIPRN